MCDSNMAVIKCSLAVSTSVHTTYYF